MDKMIEKLETSIENGAEVIVVGGGIAGVAAAVAAARSGADVLLLEKGALLGGLATNGLINWYERRARRTAYDRPRRGTAQAVHPLWRRHASPDLEG